MKYLFIIFFFLLPVSSRALGVAVNPSSLEMVYPDKQTTSINIRNISEEPVLIFIQADDFVESLSIRPMELKLLPDEVGQIQLQGDFRGYSVGLQKTNISIISKAIDKRSFNAASGLKIPLTVYLTNHYFQWSGAAVFVTVFLGLLLFALLAQLFFWLFRAKKKKKHWLRVDLSSYHKKKKIF